MILSDRDIREYIDKKQLVIRPLEEGQIQPASIDLRLGNHFLKLCENDFSLMTMTEETAYDSFVSEEVIIPSNSFLLATTREYIELPGNLTAFVEGRSSIGRMGLFIQNAGWVDPGFRGRITLELYNANRLPICLKADRRICQLVFAQMKNPAEQVYNGKYQGQQLSVGSRIFLDKENIE